MTPTERDEVLALAQSIVDGAPSTDLEERLAVVVLRYAPPSYAADALLARADRPGYAMCRHQGCEYVETVAHLRDRAHALHIAADAAEET